MLLSFECNWIITYNHVIVNSNYTIQSQVFSQSFIYQETACVAFQRIRICLLTVSAGYFDLGPMCAWAPTKYNRYSQRSAMPNRPAGAASERPKNERAFLASFRSNEGIGFLRKQPYSQRRGRCPHRPAGAASERPERTNVPLPASFPANECNGFLKKQPYSQRRVMPTSPRGVRHPSGPKERTCPFQRLSGPMNAPVSTICNLKFPVIVFYTIAYFSFSLFTNRVNCCKIE